MPPILGDKIKTRMTLEKQRLQNDTPPTPKLKNKLQRTAAKALAGFFVLMMAFTLISRASEGATIARVKGDTVKSGVLTNRISLNGKIEPLGDLSLTLPGGIKVNKIHATQGQRVEKGDPLLSFDVDDLAQQLLALEEKMSILSLRMKAAESGISAFDNQAILDAQRALNDAKTDYDRLLNKLDVSSSRSDEDLTALHEELALAKSDLEKAIQKTRKSLIESEEEKVKAASENLKTVRESAEEAIDQAETAYKNTLSGITSDKKAYDRAVSRMLETSEEYARARAQLSELESQDPKDEEAIKEAQAWVSAARTQAEAAEEALNALNDKSPQTSTDAADALNKTKEKWQKKIKEAEEKLKEAEKALADVEARTDFSEEAAVIAAQNAIEAAEKAIKTFERGIEDNALTHEEQIFNAERAIETAERALEKAELSAKENAQSDEKSRLQAEIERLGFLSEKRTLEKSIAELKEVLENSGVLLAPISGTVLNIMEGTGRTQEDQEIAKLSRLDGGFCFEASLDQKTAENLSAGDKARLKYVSSGKSHTIDAVITSIGAADDKGMVKVTASIPDGAYSSGASGEATIERKSEKYWSCLPLSALRSDANGSFVLVIREKKTVMGLEQTVVRVSVSVEARDSENMAISGAVMHDDIVVISTNKPIAEGDRVRLETDA